MGTRGSIDVLNSPLSKSILSASFPMMTIGVVSLEIVVALLPLVVARAFGVQFCALFIPMIFCLGPGDVVNDKVDEVKPWKAIELALTSTLWANEVRLVSLSAQPRQNVWGFLARG